MTERNPNSQPISDLFRNIADILDQQSGFSMHDPIREPLRDSGPATPTPSSPSQSFIPPHVTYEAPVAPPPMQNTTIGDEFIAFAQGKLGGASPENDQTPERGPDFEAPDNQPEATATESDQKSTDKKQRVPKFYPGKILRIILPDFKNKPRSAVIKTGACLGVIAVTASLFLNGNSLPFLDKAPAPTIVDTVPELQPQPALPEVNKNIDPDYLFTPDVVMGHQNPELPNQKPPATLLINADATVEMVYQASEKDLEQDPSGKTVFPTKGSLNADANGAPLEISLQQAVEVSLETVGDEKTAPYVFEKVSDTEYSMKINRSRFGVTTNILMDNGNINPDLPDKFMPLKLVGTPLEAGLQKDGVTTVPQEQADRVNSMLSGYKNDIFNAILFTQIQLLALESFQEGALANKPDELSKILDYTLEMNVDAVAKKHGFTVNLLFDENTAYDLDMHQRIVTNSEDSKKFYTMIAEQSTLYPVTLKEGAKVIPSPTYKP